MSELIKNTLIQTVSEMLLETDDTQWIREEVSAMFDVEINDELWSLLHLKAAIRTNFAPQQSTHELN